MARRRERRGREARHGSDVRFKRVVRDVMRARRGAAVVALLSIAALLAWMLRSGDAGADRASVLQGRAAESSGVATALPEDLSEPVAAQPAETPDTSAVASTGGPEPAPAILLRGRVLDAGAHPVPQAGVLLVLDRSDSWTKHWAFINTGPESVPSHVVTDADGRFEMPGEWPAVADKLRLVVHAPGFATHVHPCLGLRAGGTDTGDIVLEPGAAVTGRVVDAQRVPLPGVDIVFSDLPGGADPRGDDEIRLYFVAQRSGADGRFLAAGLRPVPMELKAEQRGLRPVVLRELPLATGGALDVGDLVLEEGGVIAGSVVDGRGAALENVSVHVKKRGEWQTFDEADGAWRSSAQSKADGSFRVGGLQAGEYDVDSMGGQPHLTMAHAEGVAVGTLDLKLVMPRYGSALVRLRDPDGAPVTGATLQATVPREFRMRAWTDANFAVSQGEAAGLEPGFYRLKGVGPEGAEISVRAAGFVPASLRAPPDMPAQEPLLDLVLARSVQIAGRVLDDAGAAIAGASVGAARAGVPLPLSAASDERGDFVLDGTDAGVWDLSASAAGHMRLSQPVAVPPGGLKGPLQLVLSRCGTVEGVALRGVQPLPAVRVHAVPLPPEGADPDVLRDALRGRGDDAQRHMRSADTDAQGRFRFDDLPPGRCLVWSSRGEHDARWAQAWAQAGITGQAAMVCAAVRPGETTVVNLVQPAGATLRVKVTADGVTREGAPVALAPADLKVGAWPFAAATAVTDAAGACEFKEVVPGHWLVVAQVPGGIVPLVAEVEARPGELRHVDLLAEGRTLRGVVVDAADGSALAGATVAFGPEIEPESSVAARLWQNNMLNVADSLAKLMHDHVTTAADGTFKVSWLPQGRYTLWTDAPGYLGGTHYAAIAPSLPDEPVRIELVRGSIVSGEVRGEGLATRQLQAGIGLPGKPPQHWASVEDGRFTFEAVEPGEYIVRIFAQPDLETALGLQRVVLAAGQSQEILVRLDG